MASQSTPTASAAPQLSVLIPTYGRPETILSLLAHIDRQTLPAERFEVVVVDDGSPQAIEIDLTQHAFQITLLRQANAGPGAARNLGLQHCRAPLTLILNDDAVPAPDLFEKHLVAQRSVAKKTALLGSFRCTARALQAPFVQILAESNLLFDFPSLKHRARLDWQHFWTCNLSLPTAALREVGGFDAERFREPIVEDVELGYRLEQLGWKVEYRNDLVCEHDHVLQPRGYFERMARLGVNMAKMAEKHGKPSLLYIPESYSRDPKGYAVLQGNVEAFHGTYVSLVEKLERLQKDQWGKQLPASTVDSITSLVRRIGLLNYWRGLLIHRHGHDPFAVLNHGPRDKGLTSIVVVSYNALEKTRKCVEALRRAADPRFPTEFLFVDNGSTDGSAEWLSEQSDIELIRNADNVGAPLARNQALARAKGAWIVVMDNDAIVTRGWLERLRFHAEVDATSGCVGPVSDRAAHGQQIAYDGKSDLDSLTEFGDTHFAAHARKHRRQNVLTSFLLLMRREVVDKIGGFDGRFSPWGFEDDDFTLRSTLAGFHNRCALDVFVRHEHYGGAKAARHNQLLEQNWRQFAEKWCGDPNAPYGDYRPIEAALAVPGATPELHVPLISVDAPAAPLPQPRETVEA